jgi:hypothetical protein
MEFPTLSVVRPAHQANQSAMAAAVSLLLWKDVIAGVAKVLTSDDEEVASIKNELAIRCLPP